jgi:hypothetical protein
MKRCLSTAALAAGGALLIAPAANATLVATIYGVYDSNACGNTGAGCLTAPRTAVGDRLYDERRNFLRHAVAVDQ